MPEYQTWDYMGVTIYVDGHDGTFFARVGNDRITGNTLVKIKAEIRKHIKETFVPFEVLELKGYSTPVIVNISGFDHRGAAITDGGTWRPTLVFRDENTELEYQDALAIFHQRQDAYHKAREILTDIETRFIKVTESGARERGLGLTAAPVEDYSNEK